MTAQWEQLHSRGARGLGVQRCLNAPGQGSPLWEIRGMDNTSRKGWVAEGSTFLAKVTAEKGRSFNDKRHTGKQK